MPELPEVETTRRGLAPHLQGRRIAQVTLYRDSLRWPIPPALPTLLHRQPITGIRRRAKFLLLDTVRGSALWHLGMSGSLRVLPGDTPLRAHDHVDVQLDDARVLRFNDPRRFGCLLWQPAGETHDLLRGLGPEPLSDAFSPAWLAAKAAGRTTSIKALILDQQTVAGIGNIYACEALFQAGISPTRKAGAVSAARLSALVAALKTTLDRAIAAGGSTLRDHAQVSGDLGYFQHSFLVYGREGQACPACGGAIRRRVQSGRSSFHCPACQR